MGIKTFKQPTCSTFRKYFGKQYHPKKNLNAKLDLNYHSDPSNSIYSRCCLPFYPILFSSHLKKFYGSQMSKYVFHHQIT